MIKGYSEILRSEVVHLSPHILILLHILQELNKISKQNIVEKNRQIFVYLKHQNLHYSIQWWSIISYPAYPALRKIIFPPPPNWNFEHHIKEVSVDGCQRNRNLESPGLSRPEISEYSFNNYSVVTKKNQNQITLSWNANDVQIAS